MATAVEQAPLRRSIAGMFVNLGRRSQTLVDRQLELIDQLENNEKDPDSLNDLFAPRPPGHPHAAQRREPAGAGRRRSRPASGVSRCR